MRPPCPDCGWLIAHDIWCLLKQAQNDKENNNE